MEKIYKRLGRDFDVDGFRIDTVKHVNIEFWPQSGRPASVAALRRPRRTSSCSARSTPPTRRSPPPTCDTGGLPATLDFSLPGGGPRRTRRRAARPRRWPTSSPRTLYTDARHQRQPADHLPRQPRHGPDRHVPAAGHPGRRRRADGPGPARPRADVPHPRQAGRLLRRRAGLHRRPVATRTPGRTCSPPGRPTTSTTT